jgi:phenylalanyl-tRNA synthetase beta chain
MAIEELLREHPQYNHLLKNLELPVILSADGEIISLPSVIISELTKIRPDTKDLFIEVTGTDPLIVSKTLNMVITSLMEHKSKIYGIIIKEGKLKHVTPDLTSSKIKLKLDYCNKLLGLNLSIKRAKGLLLRMGYDVTHKENQLIVKVPCYRTDVLHQIDLIGDIAISYGYTKFNTEMPLIPTIGAELSSESVLNMLRESLISFGYNEVINQLLTNEDILSNKMLSLTRPIVELLNPNSNEGTVCRDKLFPVMLKFLSFNKSAEYPQQVFEIGDVLIRSGNRLVQQKHLCIALANDNSNYREIKALLESVINLFNVNFKLKEIVNPSFINGRAALIIINKLPLGLIGEVHPRVLNNFGLIKPVTICEIDLSGLLPLNF